MKTLSTVFKKEFIEYFSGYKHDKKNKNYIGGIMFAVLFLIAIAVIIPVFSIFIDKYLAIRLHNILDIESRQYEFMTIVYEFSFISSVISATVSLHHVLFESDDRILYQSLPIHPAAIFVSKISFVYIKEAAITSMAILPIVAVFALKAHLSVYFVLSSLFIAVVLPIVSTATAAILCIPTYYIKRLFQYKYVFLLIFSTLFIGSLFFAYSKVLDFASQLIATGEMKFFFSEKVMNIIILITNKVYPANLCANIVLQRQVWKNALLLLGIVVIFSALALLIINTFYTRAIHMRDNLQISSKSKKITLYPPCSTYSNLLKKEFTNILRTPSYALEYFTVAIIAPLMVYSCIDIGAKLLTTLVFVERNFELSLFIILVFTSLTNTFASTSISRDGKTFMVQKTMPIKYFDIVGAKVLFASIVMIISICASLICVVVLKYVTILEALFIGFVVTVLGFAQICLAIKRDIRHPNFPQDSTNTVIETNTTVSVVILLGLLVSIVVGGVPLLNSTILAVSGKEVRFVSYLFPALSSIIVLLISTLGLQKNLNTHVDKLSERGGA